MIPVYSISKPFLAEAVLSLGLDLNDEIGSHLDLAPVYGRRTIGALLNHSSGLDDYGRLADYHAAVAQRTPAWPVAELLERCEALPHANVGFQYSNIGYLLLRLLVQKQTGLSYFDALVEHVFGKFRKAFQHCSAASQHNARTRLPFVAGGADFVSQEMNDLFGARLKNVA